MQVVRREVLECNFGELWHEYWSKKKDRGINDTKESAEETFRGESIGKPLLRIIAADIPTEAVFFHNRELLCRFVIFPTHVQKMMLESIREALNDNKINEMTITIPWSKTSTRELHVRRDNRLNLDII